jgi:hypothetical protein
MDRLKASVDAAVDAESGTVKIPQCPSGNRASYLNRL